MCVWKSLEEKNSEKSTNTKITHRTSEREKRILQLKKWEKKKDSVLKMSAAADNDREIGKQRKYIFWWFLVVVGQSAETKQRRKPTTATKKRPSLIWKARQRTSWDQVTKKEAKASRSHNKVRISRKEIWEKNHRRNTQKWWKWRVIVIVRAHFSIIIR